MNTIIGLILLGFVIMLAIGLANIALGVVFTVIGLVINAFAWIGKSIAKVWRSLE